MTPKKSDKKKRQKLNGTCSADKKRRSSKNNDKFVHSKADDEERRPMTADRGSDGTIDLSIDNYGSHNNSVICNADNKPARSDNNVIRCNYKAVLNNDDEDESVVINNISSASFNENDDEEISGNNISADSDSNRKQSTTIIINEYCLCDEGADDVSL